MNIDPLDFTGASVDAIVLQRYYDNVYICLFVNIEIKILRSHIQQSGVVLKAV